MTLYGESEDNQGYSGIFIGRVYDSDNRRNTEVETDTVGLSNHLHTKWHQRLPVTSKYGYQYRDEGDETVLDFFLETKMPNPPDFQFQMGTETYTMKFKYYLSQDGGKGKEKGKRKEKSKAKSIRKRRKGGKTRRKGRKSRGAFKKVNKKNNLSA